MCGGLGVSLERALRSPRARSSAWLTARAGGASSACHGERIIRSIRCAPLGAQVPCAGSVAAADAGVLSHAVLTEHNDVGRTGATLSETALDTCSVPGARTQLGSIHASTARL